MNYRREIDGLRAIAVMPVILFHAGFAPFSGGYVGVDIFFVISGYLITSIIVTELDAGTFTFSGFYERRARRILPALFVVTAICAWAAWYWMPPDALRTFAKGLVAVPIFASNILFWHETGYFAAASEQNPLLHTWSLAVEEQFYLLYPPFLLLLWRFGRRWVIGGLLALALTSLTYAEWAATHRPPAAFFLLPARCWELALGGLVALRMNSLPVPSSGLRAELAGFGGLGLIAWSVFAFDSSTPIPGIYSLAPTLGAALIIRFTSPSTRCGRLLSQSPVVATGLASYAAYLWHQPLFAFARLEGVPSGLPYAGLTIVALALAFLTMRFVERPWRDRSRIQRNTVAGFALASSAALITMGIIGISYQGFPERGWTSRSEILAFREYPSGPIYRTRKCFLNADQSVTEFAAECDAPTPARGAKVFLWGDSYAAHLYPGLRQKSGHALFQYTTVCPPLLGVKFDYGARCSEVEEFVLDKIRATSPDVVVLAARWRKHWKYAGSLESTLQKLKALAPQARIVLIGAMPEWEPTLPDVLSRNPNNLREGLRLNTPTLWSMRTIDETLVKAAQAQAARFISPIQLLCEDNDCLALIRNGEKIEPIAYDHGHLTERGSAVLAEHLNLIGDERR